MTNDKCTITFIANYRLKERKRVGYVTIDMDVGYVSGIEEMFTNAKIITEF